MQKILCIASFAVAALVASSTASAGVITFEDVANDTIATSQNSDGFNFAANNAGAAYVTGGTECSPACVSDGTQTLLAPGATFGTATQITMTKVGGGAFELTSLDVGGVFTGDNPAFDAGQIDYAEYDNGVLTGSGAISLVYTAGVANFTDVSITGHPATEIIFTGVNGSNTNDGFSLDNLAVSNVPEPGSVALLALGLLVLGCLRRRV